MTYENNRKYIAEAWIDNKEEEEFKKSFLNALIDQIQGHEKGFDADTVDGMHAQDILNAIQEATEHLLSDFYIGNTYFSNSEETRKYFLGFEAIKLYNIEADGTEDDEKKLPWNSIIYDNEEGREIPDLHEVIEQLYNLLYIGDFSDPTLTNYEIYNDFVNDFNENYKDALITLQSHFHNGLLNADSVNGLRFFIMSQTQYDELKHRAELYEAQDEGYEQYKGDYDKLHSIHNVFIIRSEEEIIQAGYPEGIYTDNPDTVILDKYYKFRIADAVEEGNEGKYLQYSHSDEQYTWHDMCPTEDFLDEDFLVGEILKLLNENDNYKLNPEIVKEALTHIPVSDNTNIPIVNYSKEKFITGAFYDVDGSNEQVDTSLINGFKYLDLTEIFNELKNGTENVRQLLEEYETSNNEAHVRFDGLINDANTSIQNVKGGSDKTIKDCWDKLNLIDTKLDNFLEEEFVNYKKQFVWEDMYKTEEWLSGNYTKSDDVSIWINRGLRLARIQVSHSATKDGEWKNIYRIPIKKFQPVWTTTIPSAQFDSKIRVVDDGDSTNPGRVQYYSNRGATSSNKKNVGGQGFYIFRG